MTKPKPNPFLLSPEEVVDKLKTRARKVGGQTRLAKQLKVSVPNLSDMLNLRRPISPRVLKALHLRRVTRYMRTRKPTR